jgi:hypothetical protein
MTTKLAIIDAETIHDSVWEIVDHALATFNAHEHAFRQRDELEHSDGCGCFYCFATFPPSEIKDWTDDGKTAICPSCGVDSVIGSASGFPLTKVALRRMYARSF